MKTIRKLLLLGAALGICGAAAPAHALPGPASIGLEAGLPMVVGLEASYRVRPSWRLGLEFGRVSGLTVVGAEARWLMRSETRSLVPSIVAGAEQYFLEDGGSDATPVGVHAALGIDYQLRAPFSFGIELGVMKTFGSSENDGVEVFSIRNDVSKAIFNVGAHYRF